MKIRPRIFLEGNFFVDLKPGTPSAPDVKDDGTIPVTQTSDAGPARPGADRAAGRHPRRPPGRCSTSYGEALNTKPTPAQDDAARTRRSRADRRPGAQQDAQVLARRVQERGASSTRRCSAPSPTTSRGMIAGLGKRDPRAEPREAQLQGPDHELQHDDGRDRLGGGQPARRRSACSRRRSATPTRPSATLNAAFPTTRAFARDILPGVRETPATINASFPWIAQTEALLGPNELQGVARELRPHEPEPRHAHRRHGPSCCPRSTSSTGA